MKVITARLEARVSSDKKRNTFTFDVKIGTRPFTLPEAIENLTLALCKCQKWKEHVKVRKCRKFEDLIMKIVELGKF